MTAVAIKMMTVIMMITLLIMMIETTTTMMIMTATDRKDDYQLHFPADIYRRQFNIKGEEGICGTTFSHVLGK